MVENARLILFRNGYYSSPDIFETSPPPKAGARFRIGKCVRGVTLFG